MRWALDHWDEAAPGLLGVLERFADGTDRSEEAVGAAFFILHLAAERRETRAFAPLCRLLKDAEALEEVLGDGVTTTLKRILIGTYDGDLEALKGVIEAEEADEYARAGALEVLAYLAATGRVAREEAEAYLLRLHDALRPQHESFVWYGWTSAVALLGLEAMSDVVRRAFGRGLIDPMVTNYDIFRRISGGRWPTPSGWRASGTTGSRRSRTRSGSCRAGTPSRTRPSGTGRGGRPRGRGLRAAAAGAGLQPVQARRPQRPLPVRQREEVQEVLPAPGVGPVGRRLAVSASTLTRRDPATTVTAKPRSIRTYLRRLMSPELGSSREPRTGLSRKDCEPARPFASPSPRSRAESRRMRARAPLQSQRMRARKALRSQAGAPMFASRYR